MYLYVLYVLYICKYTYIISIYNTFIHKATIVPLVQNIHKVCKRINKF